jgi:hypothetical protein
MDYIQKDNKLLLTNEYTMLVFFFNIFIFYKNTFHMKNVQDTIEGTSYLSDTSKKPEIQNGYNRKILLTCDQDFQTRIQEIEDIQDDYHKIREYIKFAYQIIETGNKEHTQEIQEIIKEEIEYINDNNQYVSLLIRRACLERDFNNKEEAQAIIQKAKENALSISPKECLTQCLSRIMNVEITLEMNEEALKTEEYLEKNPLRIKKTKN